MNSIGATSKQLLGLASQDSTLDYYNESIRLITDGLLAKIEPILILTEQEGP